jgi:hypothetical protein
MLKFVLDEGPQYTLITNGDDSKKLTVLEARIIFSDNKIREKCPWIDKNNNKYILV